MGALGGDMQQVGQQAAQAGGVQEDLPYITDEVDDTQHEVAH